MATIRVALLAKVNTRAETRDVISGCLTAEMVYVMKAVSMSNGWVVHAAWWHEVVGRDPWGECISGLARAWGCNEGA